MFELNQPTFTVSYAREMAANVAAEYLRTGIEPNASLIKMARLEGWLPHQVQMVATETNKRIHQEKYASAQEKYFAADFPLADSAKILKDLQVDGCETKIAAIIAEPKIEIDPYDLFGIKPEEMDKTASVKGELKEARVRLDVLQTKTANDLQLSKVELIGAERAFIKSARNHALGMDTAPERLKFLGGLDHIVKKAQFTSCRPVLAKLAHVLGQDGKLGTVRAERLVDYFTKEADQKAPPELISENLNAQIINGNHPLYISLKTIEDKDALVKRYEQDNNNIKTKLRILDQKVRAL